MRRGQTRSKVGPGELGWSKQELLESGGISAKTFDMIRKAARVSGPHHGGLTWVFSLNDVEAIVRKAESGKFTERGAPAAVGWRQMLRDQGVHLPKD